MAEHPIVNVPGGMWDMAGTYLDTPNIVVYMAEEELIYGDVHLKPFDIILVDTRVLLAPNQIYLHKRQGEYRFSDMVVLFGYEVVGVAVTQIRSLSVSITADKWDVDDSSSDEMDEP